MDFQTIVAASNGTSDGGKAVRTYAQNLSQIKSVSMSLIVDHHASNQSTNQSTKQAITASIHAEHWKAEPLLTNGL